MATSKEIRRENLLLLLGPSKGGQAELARGLDVDPAYVSQLVVGKRNIGDAVARKIEVLKDKPEGWMDTPHPIELPSEGARLEPMQAQLLFMFERLSDDAKERVLGRAQALYVQEHQGAAAPMFGPTVFESDVTERHSIHEPPAPRSGKKKHRAAAK